MELKHCAFNWWIVINFIIISYNGVSAQTLYERYRSFWLKTDSLDIADFDKAFIIHFNVCTGPRYCGDNLIRYIEKNKNNRILILCDDLNNKYLKSLKNNSYQLHYTDFILLDSYGLFSVYNIEITKNKKVKKLL